MKFEIKPLTRNASNDELLQDIRRVASECGGKITIKEYIRLGKYSRDTIERRFETWNKALDAAGLELTLATSHDITEDQLFENIEDVWLRLGRQPTSKEIRRPLSRFSIRPYVLRFGSWYKALEKFVDLANSEQTFSAPEQIIPDQDSNIEIKHKTKRDINWRMRWHVLNRDNFRCVSCGLSPAIAPGTVLHVDHKKPWSKGGETVLENLQTLCGTCNLRKGNTE